MSDDDFVDSFMSECLVNDIRRPADICKAAEAEIEKIELELSRVTDLRAQRDNYLQVLRTFGHDTAKARGRRNTPPMVNPDIATADDDPGFLGLVDDVCSEIEKSDIPLTPRTITANVGFGGRDPSPVYVALKWLLDRGILFRLEDRSFLPGKNWDSRRTKTTTKEA